MDTTLKSRIAPHAKIGLDTSIFIYQIEAHSRYRPLTQQVLTRMELGLCQGITSVMSLLELTVHPWRIERQDIARQYELILVNFPNLTLAPVTRDIARQATRIRAKYNTKPPDSVQIATSIVYEATAFVTNDKQLQRLAPELEVIVLDHYASF